MQQSKPLVRFLVWAQFAMPLWFVFLNAAIATDLLLSQLLRLNVARLQAIHRWYLPVASLTAFTLALPLLIYHSAYQPTANVFSVQFPSVLAVTLYYILAFDLWIAIGILYCFVVVSLVVGVIVIKLRKKRAAWDRQNRDQQVESGWVSRYPATEIKASNDLQQQQDQHRHVTVTETETTTPAINARGGEERNGGSSLHIRRYSCESTSTTTTDSSIHSIQYSESYRLQTFFADHKARNSSSSRQPPPAHSAEKLESAGDPGATLVSGITFTDRDDAAIGKSTDSKHKTMSHPKSVLFVVPFNDGEESSSGSSFSTSGSVLSEISAIDVAQLSARHEPFSSGITAINSPEITQAVDPPQSTSSTANDSTHIAKIEPAIIRKMAGPLTALQILLPQFTLRSSNQSTFASQSYSTPFRIPTLALVRLLLYPLIPIFSFTLMCVVRWVWFRSAMPERWEILNVVSGFLRAMEGLLCLVVFLLNPALNRSFREIRKRNTPVFT
ncbi:hypothetical protein IWW38_001895 [Coemansia aciculifera]|uniref:Uncharacterized protein n=1 Tax=Coemansia aciculifera TaxID=417176 RepID=A0ACC1M523_9FUNG|nr:hypothetical protein IWW38_001895 [Coemansia aciculifera]